MRKFPILRNRLLPVSKNQRSPGGKTILSKVVRSGLAGVVGAIIILWRVRSPAHTCWKLDRWKLNNLKNIYTDLTANISWEEYSSCQSKPQAWRSTFVFCICKPMNFTWFDRKHKKYVGCPKKPNLIIRISIVLDCWCYWHFNINSAQRAIDNVKRSCLFLSTLYVLLHEILSTLLYDKSLTWSQLLN